MDSMKDRVSGMADEAEGKGKSAWGDATGDAQTQAEGEKDEASGKAQQGMADVKDKPSDLLDKVKDKIGQ